MVLIIFLVVVVIIVVLVKNRLRDRDSVGAGETWATPTPTRTPAPAAPRPSYTPVRPPPPPGWTCALDFGTTYSKASWWTPGQEPEVVRFDPYHGFRSAVGICPDGSLLLGQKAETYRHHLPSHVELYPKKWVGEVEFVLLGGTSVPVVELVAAVLREAFDAAKAEAPSGPLHEVVLTHPAAWTETQKDILKQAGHLAGIAHDTLITLVPEPVAAAARWAQQEQSWTVPGTRFAVYDFGGGTLDLAVVMTTESGFDVIDKLGRENLGGANLDAALFHGAGAIWGERHPDRWQRLSHPTDDDWTQARTTTLENAMWAKEVLAQQPSTSLFIRPPDGGGPDQDGWNVPINRRQFEWWIKPVVQATVDALDSITRRNALPPDTPVYLSGGSSRTGLVRTLLDAAQYPLVGAGNNGDDPELTVVQGAVLMGRMRHQL